jgi:hypothetical protein
MILSQLVERDSESVRPGKEVCEAPAQGRTLFPCFILREKSINNLSLRNISEAFLPVYRIGDLRRSSREVYPYADIRH